MQELGRSSREMLVHGKYAALHKKSKVAKLYLKKKEGEMAWLASRSANE